MEIKNRLSEWGIYSNCNVNKTDMTITLPNGSRFLFKGLDDPEKIKSISGICDIWCEEATELQDVDFDQLCLRLRNRNKKNNQVYVSFNPVSKSNWVYKRWFAENAEKDNDTFVLKTTYKDNKFLPVDYIDNLLKMKKTNYPYYKIYAEGDFASLGKKVYTNWEIKQFNPQELFKDDDIKVSIGLDFGFATDPTAIICCIIKESTKEMWVYDEAYLKGYTNEEIYNHMLEMKIHKSRVVCDCAEPKSIEELRRLGATKCVPCKKGKDSINYGIQLIQGFHMYILPSCKDVIEELENYEYQKDRQTGEYINKPIDNYNHLMDAWRYAITDVIKRRKGGAKFYKI